MLHISDTAFSALLPFYPVVSISSSFKFEMFPGGQTMSKGGCQHPGTSREKNNSFSSFLFPVVTYWTWEFFFFILKNPSLRIFIYMLKLIIGFGVQKGFFPADLVHRAYSFQLFLFSSIGHGSSLCHKRSTLNENPDIAETSHFLLATSKMTSCLPFYCSKNITYKKLLVITLRDRQQFLNQNTNASTRACRTQQVISQIVKFV